MTTDSGEEIPLPGRAEELSGRRSARSLEEAEHEVGSGGKVARGGHEGSAGSEVEQEVGSGGKVTRCGHEWSAREVAGDYESLDRNS